MFLKNKNIIFKSRRSKVTDYAALNLLYVMHLCGVDDSVENYQSIWLHVVRSWCLSPMKSFFFHFVIRTSISLMILMRNYAFNNIFSLRILLLAVENV